MKIILLLFLMSCAPTFQSISKIPNIVNGQEVYTYTGRANYSHQQEVADQALIDLCEEKGKTPVIVDKAEYSVGIVRIGDALMDNRNQKIMFICKD